MRDHVKVRNRLGEPCPVCGTTIRRVGVLGYDSFFCPRCQPAEGTLGGKRGDPVVKSTRQTDGPRRPRALRHRPAARVPRGRGGRGDRGGVSPGASCPACTPSSLPRLRPTSWPRSWCSPSASASTTPASTTPTGASRPCRSPSSGCSPPAGAGTRPRQAAVLLLLGAWAVRLTANCLVRWRGLGRRGLALRRVPAARAVVLARELPRVPPDADRVRVPRAACRCGRR